MYIDDDLRMVLKEASVHSTVILRCRCHADCGAEIQRQESIWSSLPIRFSAKLILSQFNELFKGGLKASRTFTSDHLKFCDLQLSETFVYSTHIEKYWSKHLKVKVLYNFNQEYFVQIQVERIQTQFTQPTFRVGMTMFE